MIAIAITTGVAMGRQKIEFTTITWIKFRKGIWIRKRRSEKVQI